MSGKILKLYAHPADPAGADGLLDLADLRQIDAVVDVHKTDLSRAHVDASAEVIVRGGDDTIREGSEDRLVCEPRGRGTYRPGRGGGRAHCGGSAHAGSERLAGSASPDQHTSGALAVSLYARSLAGLPFQADPRRLRSPLADLLRSPGQIRRGVPHWVLAFRLAWRQLRSEPARLVAAITGVMFATILVLMQLGFRGALFDTAIALPQALHAELFLINPLTMALFRAEPIPRVRGFQAMSLPEATGNRRPRSDLGNGRICAQHQAQRDPPQLLVDGHTIEIMWLISGRILKNQLKG